MFCLLEAPGLAASSTPAPSLAAWISGGAALIAALIAAMVALKQQRHARRLEREKIELQEQFARERIIWQEERDETKTRNELATQADQERKETEQIQTKIQQDTINYRSKIVYRLGHLKILDMSKPLDLEQVYVQVRVREESPRYVSDEEIEELACGAPDRLLKLSQERTKSESVTAISPDQAIREFHRVIIVGDPGAGKSTMLRHLALKAARDNIDHSINFPIYIELSGFIDSEHRDLLSYAAAELDDLYGFPGGTTYLHRAIQDEKAILLLDGLDEVLGGATEEAAETAYHQVVEEIDRLSARYPSVPMAVTCRRAGWRGGLTQFRTLEALDFDWPQIQKFIQNWFFSDEKKAAGLQETLSRNLRMQTLAANPLLLSLIAIVYERDLELPERRAELYNRCLEVLLKEWDSHRGIKRFSRFTADRKRDLLEEIAWHFHCTGRRYFPHSEVIEIISDFLPTIDIPRNNAPEILEEIATQYGLLKTQAHGWYGFLHLTIQEYLAALAANDRGISALRAIAQRRHDPWWQEVILLLSGRMSDSSPLMLALLGRDPNMTEPPADESLAADDDIFLNDIQLVGRCLIGVPRIRSPWLRDRVVLELERLILTSIHRVNYQQLAQVFAEIGGPAVRERMLSIVGNEVIAPERREAIARALGTAGDKLAAPELLAILESRSTILDAPTSSIAEALGKLQYVQAGQVLSEIVHSSLPVPRDSAATLRWSKVVRACGELNERSILPILRDIFYQAVPYDGSVSYSAVVSTIGILGDTSDYERLLRLLDSERPVRASYETARAVLSLGGDDAVRALFNLVFETDRALRSRRGIINALSRAKSPLCRPLALEVLSNATCDWQKRWSATEILDGQPMAGSDSALTEILSNPHTNAYVKVGVAATLAAWNNPVGLPELRTALLQESLPQHLRGRTSLPADSRDLWRRTARALKKLGDRSVVPQLLNRYDAAQQSGDRWKAEILQETLVSFGAVGFGERILNASDTRRSSLLSLTSCMDESLVSLAFNVLESEHRAQQEQTPRFRSQDIIRAIGYKASNSESVRRLLRLIESGEFDALLESLISALHKVCDRAGVRPFADGRIISVGNRD